MAKRFPVLYPMPFGENQYRQYLELAVDPLSYDDYINKCWELILKDNPRTCKKHKDLGEKKPIDTCQDCMRYHPTMIKKTVDNLVRCGFLLKTRGYICPEHNKVFTRKGKKVWPKPVKACPNCKPSISSICSEHQDMGLEVPDPDCSLCSEGDTTIETTRNGKKWLDGKLKGGFPTLVRDNIKTSWGYQLRFPNGIKATLDILSEFTEGSGAISGTDMYKNLAFEQEGAKKKGGYDFNYAGEGSRRSIREIMKLLVEMEAIEDDGRNKYMRGPKYGSCRNVLSNADLIKSVEKIIKDYGPRADILPDKDKDIALKSILAKHYLYVQAGGIGKDRWFLSRIYKALYDTVPEESPIEMSTRRRPIIPDHKIAAERDRLREEISNKWHLSKTRLKNYKIGALRDILVATSEDDVIFKLDSYSSKFNRPILDKLCHNDGIFQFPKDFKFYSGWQDEAVTHWMNGTGATNHKEYNGIVSVVTGAGKTVMALLAISKYIKKFPNAKVSIIVPTRVLMYQWARELARLLAIPSDSIGLRGDGFKDHYQNKQIMILIVNSAIQSDFILNETSKLNKSTKHLLIADECHRYTGEKFHRIFKCRRDANLGLSATPIERDSISEEHHKDKDEEDSVLIKELGPIFYELNYRQALKKRLISEFSINYVGVDFTLNERIIYDSLTKRLAKILEKIRMRYGPRLELIPGNSLDQKLQTILKTDEHPDRAISQYFQIVRDRRVIVYNATNRKGAFYYLLSDAIKENRKIIVFHERIDQLEEIVAPATKRKFEGKDQIRVEKSSYEADVDKKIEALLYNSNYKPVMYHSGHSKDFWNQWAMDWYRGNEANTMLSVKALIEGVDVPSADVGIVRISSSSVRQRIQATGRILRKAKKKKRSDMYVIFVKHSVDENIFRKYNWEEELGSSDINYYNWVPKEDDLTTGSLEKRGRDELPEIKEYEDNKPPIEVDTSALKPGDEYPGRYAGDMYHVSAYGEPFQRTKFGRIMIENPDVVKIGQEIRKLKGGGKFLVTPQGNAITSIKGQGLLFLGSVDSEAIKEELKEKRVELEKEKKKKGKKITWDDLFA